MTCRDDARDAFRRHGGNLAAAAAAFPGAPRPWIDLSTGISPYPHPFQAPDPSAHERLPDAARQDDLLAAARRAYGAAGAVDAVAAPGTQILIQLLPVVRPAERVAVVGPTYSEHGQTWRRIGADVREVRQLEDAGDADVVVLVNPNNPDGRLVAPDRVRDWAAGRTGDSLIVIDEAFADLVEGASLLPAGVPTNGIVLRSFGKTYGLAGVRIGFAFGSCDLIARLQELLGPWSVPGPALEIGIAAFRDDAWRADTARRLQADCARLDDLLESAGLRIIGGTSLFRLAETHRAGDVFEHLACAGILVRPFDYQPSWLRFGIPRSCEWTRLEAALRAMG